MELTCNELVDLLDFKYFVESATGFTLPSGIYELLDNNLRLAFLLPDDTKVGITVDDIRLRSSLTTNKTIKLTKKLFFIPY